MGKWTAERRRLEMIEDGRRTRIRRLGTSLFRCVRCGKAEHFSHTSRQVLVCFGCCRALKTDPDIGSKELRGILFGAETFKKSKRHG